MFNFAFNEQDLKIIEKLKESKVRSRKVVGRGTLVADASEIRKTKSFQANAERAAKLVAAD